MQVGSRSTVWGRDTAMHVALPSVMLQSGTFVIVHPSDASTLMNCSAVRTQMFIKHMVIRNISIVLTLLCVSREIYDNIEH